MTGKNGAGATNVSKATNMPRHRAGRTRRSAVTSGTRGDEARSASATTSASTAVPFVAHGSGRFSSRGEKSTTIGTPSGRGPPENLDRPVTALHDQALTIPMHDRPGWRWLMLHGSVRCQAGLGNL